ncbi:hypothetical protein V1477_003137 [Vespula maculifrons]|uniref:Uncharacterized protein n=1 Tax=Vespula maculifrons TaxID=7453 RepID=A0ABD2CTP1_VESMC
MALLSPGNRSKNGSEFNESSRESWLRSKYRSKEDEVEEEEEEEEKEVKEVKGGVVTWGGMAWRGMVWRGVAWCGVVIAMLLTSEFCPTLEKLQHLREQCRCLRDCKIFPGTIHLQGLLTVR